MRQKFSEGEKPSNSGKMFEDEIKPSRDEKRKGPDVSKSGGGWGKDAEQEKLEKKYDELLEKIKAWEDRELKPLEKIVEARLQEIVGEKVMNAKSEEDIPNFLGKKKFLEALKIAGEVGSEKWKNLRTEVGDWDLNLLETRGALGKLQKMMEKDPALTKLIEIEGKIEELNKQLTEIQIQLG